MADRHLPPFQRFVLVNQCSRCGHQWMPRQGKKLGQTKFCPKCQSPYWNRPRVRSVKRPSRILR